MIRSTVQVSKSEVTVRGGVVSTQHPLASEAGARILQAGGNAVDAAVAATAAVNVVEPMMSGIGGGGMMMVHDPRTGRDTAIDFLPRVPNAASPDMFVLEPSRPSVNMYNWPAVRNDENFIGHRAVGIPGTIAGLCAAHARWGKLSLAAVLEPAIEYAEEGYNVDWYIAAVIGGTARNLRRFQETAAIFLPDGLPPASPLRVYMPTGKLRQPDLATTLKRIARNGPDDFYRGETARMIVAEMECHGGLITADDMARYRAGVYEETLTATYRGHTLSTVPLPCGSNTVIEALNILENFDVRGIGRDSTEGLSLMAQAQSLAFQDRFAYLADPNQMPIPAHALLAKDYAAERAEAVRLDGFAGALPPGYPLQRGVALADNPPDRSCTTHLGVVDKDGMMVSLTNTIGDLWGSYVVAKGTGVVLNGAMAWFNPVPGHINSVAPGKMPLSAISAMLVHKDGKPYITIGAPGARKVMTAVLQSVVNVIDHEMTLQDAIAAPRIHCEKEEILADTRLGEVRLQDLRSMGFGVQPLEETFLSSNFARPVGALIDEEGIVYSGVDVLRPATAIGVPA
jgi:gamma-glutamyltranspeptidase/glutathione hydrolase